MAVIRNDSEALVVTYDRVGRMALFEIGVFAILLLPLSFNSLRFAKAHGAERADPQRRA